MLQEQQYAAEHAHDHDDDMDSGMKKSPSEFSCGSVEVYIPANRKTSHFDDKERISIKSECCVDGVRRLSIVNSRGKKVLVSNRYRTETQKIQTWKIREFKLEFEG